MHETKMYYAGEVFVKIEPSSLFIYISRYISKRAH